MNDQLIMENYLLVLKSNVEVFVHGTLESSNKKVKDILKHGLDETLKHQENTYNKMTEYGWYQINNVKPSEIEKVLNKVNKKDS